MARRDAKPVYSTTDGDLRKARDPAEKARLSGDGIVRVRRETSGRKGKTGPPSRACRSPTRS